MILLGRFHVGDGVNPGRAVAERRARRAIDQAFMLSRKPRFQICATGDTSARLRDRGLESTVGQKCTIVGWITSFCRTVMPSSSRKRGEMAANVHERNTAGSILYLVEGKIDERFVGPRPLRRPERIVFNLSAVRAISSLGARALEQY